MAAICMLNALWFKPDGGAQMYAQYGEAVTPILDSVGAELFFPPMRVVQALEGGFDPDLVVFVRYPSKEAFNGMWRTEAYEKIAHLRTDAITKAVLTRCSVEPEDARPFQQAPPGVFVFNGLYFRDGGAPTYDEYLRQAEPLVRARGGQFMSPRLHPEKAMGEDFVPDLVFLGNYPSLDAVFDLVASPEYQEPSATRTRAVDHSVTTVLSAGGWSA